MRWTSSKTDSLQSPIGCTISFQEHDDEVEQDMLGAAVLDELPGELENREFQCLCNISAKTMVHGNSPVRPIGI